MIEPLSHRGPDGSGIWYDDENGVAVGHTRLSVLDVSSAGSQPMVSSSGRYVITFNGEIYNHLELRSQLLSQRSCSHWNSGTDTETVLELVETYGFFETLQKIEGMFAFAIWDRQKRKLSIARDRIGEKPLYYGYQDKSFYFSSELNSFVNLRSFDLRIDRDSIGSLLRFNYIPAPYSIFEGVFKLMPGHMYEAFDDGNSKQYWSVLDCEKHSQESAVSCGLTGLSNLKSTIKRAVKKQMLSDVPIGAFLSGGVDSSLVVALMQENHGAPINTFSIGFEDKQFDEAIYAKQVSKILGTQHHELVVTDSDALSVVPRLARIYSEPFSDSSQIPTVLVSEMAKNEVTVALSGDGGDELFGGYNRYLFCNQMQQRINRLPISLRRPLASNLLKLTPSTINSIYGLFRCILPIKYQFNNFGDKVHKIASIMTENDNKALYRELVSHWESPESVVIGCNSKQRHVTYGSDDTDFDSFLAWMMYADLVSYLPDDILVKVDRAAMSTSLETRAPFLDPNVINAAVNLPMSFKLRDGQTKWCLKEILADYLPRDLINRPKMGFGVPLAQWLRGPLKSWAHDLLQPEKLRREGYFDERRVSQVLSEHVNGHRDWHYHLWDVLMFQSWKENVGL